MLKQEMSMTSPVDTGRVSSTGQDYDAIIIGAGISGIYQLFLLRQLGLRVRLLESGTGVGGTWYWNRYPGARFDSESYSYGFFFSKELLQEWNWSEHFAAQPETLRYLDFVTDKFDLRRDMQFSSRVVAARFQVEKCSWQVTLGDGSTCSSRFLIAAVGPLSAPTLPRLAGVDEFQGQSFHTARWPQGVADFEGKRVAVVGTAATGIQVIQEVAKTAKHLTVFQRTANYAVPLNNARIDNATQQKIRASYPDIYARCQTTFGWFLHAPDPRSALEVTPEEREAFYEELYNAPGLGIWQGNFRDVLSDVRANETISEFVRKKIRQRVKNPVVAEMLVPKDHGFGTRRVPLETRYYEVYNQPNVQLVDIKVTPIEEVKQRGIRTSVAEYEFDMIIYATGFDAVTGAFDHIDITGLDGRKLKDKWTLGPCTFLGMQASGFPNFFMPAGPLSALGNIPRGSEYTVNWITNLIGHMNDKGLKFANATREAEEEWTENARAISEGLLASKVNSWFNGFNSNVDGKQNRVVALYRGGAPAYRARCEEVAANAYAGIELR